MQLHEELHINGAAGQASFHVGSPIVNLCFQLDGLPPVAQIYHDRIEQEIQDLEEHYRHMRMIHWNVDGEDDKGMPDPDFLVTQSNHPAFAEARPGDMTLFNVFNPRPSQELLETLALKFDNYANSV